MQGRRTFSHGIEGGVILSPIFSPKDSSLGSLPRRRGALAMHVGFCNNTHHRSVHKEKYLLTPICHQVTIHVYAQLVVDIAREGLEGTPS